MKTIIKQKAKEYAQSIAQNEERQKYCEEDFAKGAEWAIGNVCAWLSEHFYDGIYQFQDDEGTWIAADDMIEDIQQYYKKGGDE